jgi:hypothetical protein
MQAVVIGIVTTLIGIIVAILVTRHYYVRSIKHRLAVYSMPSPSIFYGVDPEIRSGLSIQFRGEAVEQLSVIEFLIANEGADAIRQSIEPLAFNMGNKCRIVDASVTYMQPEGRDIKLETASDHEFKCVFVLLNPNEYFYVKVIADGRIKISDIECTITAENLPPRIKIESAEGVNIGPGESSRDLTFLVPAIFVLLLGAILALPLVGLYEVHPEYFPFSWSKFAFVWWLTVPIFIVGIAACTLVIASLAMAVVAVAGDIPRRPRFKRPGRPYHAHMYYYHGFPPFPEPDSALTRYPRDRPET